MDFHINIDKALEIIIHQSEIRSAYIYLSQKNVFPVKTLKLNINNNLFKTAAVFNKVRKGEMRMIWY